MNIFQMKISTKLACLIGTALVALCVMGGIAVYSAQEIQRQGQELYSESNKLLSAEIDVLVNFEGAVANVYSAPSEIDLNRLKSKQEHFYSVLSVAKNTLQSATADSKADDIKSSASKVIAAIGAIEKNSKKVFELTAAFAQPEAIATLSATVIPAEVAVQTALKEFRDIVERHGAERVTVIQATNSTITGIVIGLAAILVVGLAILSFVIAQRGIIRPLSALIGPLENIAGGNFAVVVPGTGRRDEVGRIASAVAQMAEKVSASIGEIMASGREVTNASAEISTSTTDLSQRTEEQAASLEETSAAMEQLSATVRKNSENAQMANTDANNARNVADRGGQVVAKAVDAMAKIEDSSRKISDIIGVIDEIARQTNLLALNAAVEAARAGEAGRGFAVVASEVRSLAQRSSQAAKDIKDLITNSNSQVKDGVELVNKAGDSLTEILDSIKKVAAVVSDIANASVEQATGIEQINKALTQMDEATQQNSALVEENSATAKTLEHQAKAMDEQIAFFQIGDNDRPSPNSLPRAKTSSAREISYERAEARAVPKQKPVVQMKQVSAANGNGGAVRRMQTELKTAINADSDWKEF